MSEHTIKMKDYRQAQVARCNIISRMLLRGHTYAEIRKEVMARLGLPTYSMQTVHKDVKRLLNEWREMRAENTDEGVQLYLQSIREVMRQAWEAWDKSKTDYEKSKVKKRGQPKRGTDGGISTIKVEQEKETATKNGDPRYLEIILKVLEREAKILGYDRPVRVDLCGIPDGAEDPGKKYADMLPTDVLVKVASMLQDCVADGTAEAREEEGDEG